MNNHDEFSVSLLLEEQAGRKRDNEPVTIGLPFPQGVVFVLSCLTLWDAGGRQLPLQTRTLTHWFDGSAKWVLLDFQASVEASTQTAYQLRSIPGQRIEFQSPSLAVRESTEHVIVDTGGATFFLSRHFCKPFDRVLVHGADCIAAEG